MAIGFAVAPCIAYSQPAAQPDEMRIDEMRIVVNGVRNQNYQGMSQESRRNIKGAEAIEGQSEPSRC